MSRLTRIGLAKRFSDGLLRRRWFITTPQRDVAKRIAARVIGELRDSPDGSPSEDWRSTTESICRRWGKPDVGNLAVNWGAENCGSRISKGYPREHLVEAATVAVLTGAERLVRSGNRVYIPRLGVELNATADYSAVRMLAMGNCKEAELARRALASQEQDPEHWTEPWNWDLEQEARRWGHWSEEDRYGLLARLAEYDACGLGVFTSAPGSRWNRKLTRPCKAPAEGDDGVWIVVETCRQGIRTASNAVMCKEKARISTVDATVLFDGTCPVGRWLRSRGRDLVPGGEQGYWTWRARYGFHFPGDLRDDFDEKTLANWRRRMVREINPQYDGSPACQLEVTGHEGDFFRASTMDVCGDVPAGDARVSGVVERDGVLQQGLACPGGNPLLLAVVGVETL